MTRGGKIFSCIFAVIFMFCAAFIVYAVEAPDEITIKDSLWPTPTKPPVKFSHKKHAQEYKIACGQCHHIVKDGKKVPLPEGAAVEKCDKCHTEATIVGEKKLSPDLQKKNLKLAFHDNCIPCHKKAKEGKPTVKAPTTCNQCHVK